MIKAGNKNSKKLSIKSKLVPSLTDLPSIITKTEIKTNATMTKRMIGAMMGL